MIFQPEHAEDISDVYVVNQICESVSDLLVKQIWKRIGPLPMAMFLCVFLPVLLIKRLRIAVFLLIKMKPSRIKVCEGATGNILVFSLA